MDILLLFKHMENFPAGKTAWFDATLAYGLVQSLENAAVDLEHVQTRCDKPYMVESDLCKLTSPTCGYTNTTAQCAELVT
jgi:hypothetical protein